MALIVEDGSIVPNADSYCSEDDATAYHENMGNEEWADVENKEAMLRRATAYMVQVYRSRWAGNRVSSAQALDWPRFDVPLKDSSHYNYVPENIVPKEVREACAELALRANSGSLAPDQERMTKTETIGPISVTYANNDVGYTRYRAVDGMLAPYLTGSSLTASLLRV